MTDGIGAEVAHKLDVLISLMAISILGEKTQKQQIDLLGRAGLAAKEIAGLVGTTPNTVSVTLSKLRRDNGKARHKEEC